MFPDARLLVLLDVDGPVARVVVLMDRMVPVARVLVLMDVDGPCCFCVGSGGCGWSLLLVCWF